MGGGRMAPSMFFLYCLERAKLENISVLFVRAMMIIVKHDIDHASVHTQRYEWKEALFWAFLLN